MNNPVCITSLTNSRVKNIVKLRKQRGRVRAGQFIAEGIREVSRAMDAGLICDELYYCHDILSRRIGSNIAGDMTLPKPSNGTLRFEVSEPVFLKMTYRAAPEGILGVFKTVQFAIEDLPKVTDDTIFLVVAGIEKPGNLGAMARTASSAGCQALFVVDSVVDSFNPNSIRASTGAVFSLPIITIERSKLLDYFIENSVEVFPAMVDSEIDYTKANMNKAKALVIGAEDTGLDDWWKGAAINSGGQPVKIPMHSSAVDSLNASNAAAILLYEARRNV